MVHGLKRITTWRNQDGKLVSAFSFGVSGSGGMVLIRGLPGRFAQEHVA
uniref:Uncharacterized protein n=1 Tax=Arundo donax TaxID=35708 RepID=A0A0A9HXU0_ARUDO